MDFFFYHEEDFITYLARIVINGATLTDNTNIALNLRVKN